MAVAGIFINSSRNDGDSNAATGTTTMPRR
jgi:hypothetical protein